MTMASTLLRAKRAWCALVDKNTGSTYYIDETTGVSQWEKPPDMDESFAPHSQDRVAGAVVAQPTAAKSDGGTATSHLEDSSLSATVTVPDSTSFVEARLKGTQRSEEPSRPVVDNATTLADISAQNSEDDRSDLGRQRVLADELHIDVDSSKENQVLTGGRSTLSRNNRAVTNVGDSSHYSSTTRVDSVRPSSAHGDGRQEKSGGGEQNYPSASPATVITAWPTPNSQEGGGVEGFIEPKNVEPESAIDHGRRVGAGGDDTNSLSDFPSSRKEGDMGSVQLTMREEKGEGEGKGEEQEVYRKRGGSGGGGGGEVPFANNGMVPARDTSDLSDKLQIAVISCENQVSSSPQLNAPHSDCEHQQNANPEDASLPRLDSSSTLSTDTGGLDALAQYVTGHSSTLDGGVVLEPPIRWPKEEVGANGDDDARALEPSVEGNQSSHDSSTTSMAETRSTGTTPQRENEDSSTETIAPAPPSEMVQDASANVEQVAPAISGILPHAGKSVIEPHFPLQMQQSTAMAQPVPSNSNAGRFSSAHTSGQQQSIIPWSENEAAAVKIQPACPQDGTAQAATPALSPLHDTREDSRQAVINRPTSSLPVGRLEGEDDKSEPQPSSQDTYRGSTDSNHTSTDEQQANPLHSEANDAYRMDELSSETERHRVDNPCLDAALFPDFHGDTGEFTGEHIFRPLPGASSTRLTKSIVDEIKRCDTNSASTVVASNQGISKHEATPAPRIAAAITGEPGSSCAGKSCATEGSDLQPAEAVRDAMVEVTVKLQAYARGWAARQLYARIVARRETMIREAWEAQQRAAAAIQSLARCHLARRNQRKAREVEAWSDQHHTGHTPVQERGATMNVDVVDDDTPFVAFRSEQPNHPLTATAVSIEGNDYEVNLRVVSKAPNVRRVDGSSGRETGEPIDGAGKVISGFNSDVESCYRRNDAWHDDNEDKTITTNAPAGEVLQGEQNSHDNEKCAEGNDWMANVEHGWMETVSGLETIHEEVDSQTQQQHEAHFWNRANAEEGSSDRRTDSGNGVMLTTEVPTPDFPGVVHSAAAADTDKHEEWAGDTDEANEAYPKDGHDSSTSSGDVGSSSDPKDRHDSSSSSGDVGSSSDLTGPDDTSKSVGSFCRSEQSSLASDDSDNQHPANSYGINTENDCVQHRASVEHAKGGTNGMWEVFRDTTAPLKTLEDLRSNVAKQAEAMARKTMTATGTDASRREASRIRYVDVYRKCSNNKHISGLSS